MAGIFDDIMPDVASTLFKVFGGESSNATLTRNSSVRDPLTMVQTQSDTVWPITIGPPEAYSTFLVDGQAILATDMKASFAANDLPAGVTLVPYVPSSLTLGFNGMRFVVINVTPLYSGALIAMYTLQLRR